MKINFDYPTEQIQCTYSLGLAPGENDLPDEIAKALIAGSDALIANVARTKKISEDEARAQLKGKGMFTAVPAASSSAVHAPPAPKKREKGGEK